METIILTIIAIILLIISLIVNLQINHKMSSAQETLEQFVVDFGIARDAIIARIDAILNNSGDLTAEEVTELLTPIKQDLENIGNPPA